MRCLPLRASNKPPPLQLACAHCNFAYSAFAAFRMGDVGIGVFPECQEIPVCRFGLGGVVLQGVGAGEAEMSECARKIIL